MRLLLDTHIFLWFVTGDTQLSSVHRAAIEDPGNVVYLSVVSQWEATIKYMLGRLPLSEPPDVLFPGERRFHDMIPLDLTEGAVEQLHRLPLLHNDPFDRILICQALEHGLLLVTHDKEILQYEAPLFESNF